MASDDPVSAPPASSWLMVAVAWLLVSVPLLWGVWTTLAKAAVLFR